MRRVTLACGLFLVTIAFGHLFGSLPRNMAITVWTTEDAEDKAQKVAAAAKSLENAVVELEEIKSYYWWEGKVNFDPEWRVSLSTTAPFEVAEATISKVHSYDLPMIIYNLAEEPPKCLKLSAW